MVMRMMIILLQLVLVIIAAASPSPSSAETVMCRPDERDALLSFKSAFSIYNSCKWDIGIGWARTEWWEKDGNCCEWDGVTCDPQTSHVVEIDLTLSCLSGSIPSNTTLFRLPNLQRLDLSSNYLSGSIPSNTTLFRIPNLQILDLSSNFLSGQVPQEIANMDTSVLAGVTDIDLSQNMLTGVIPGWLFTLPSLSSLYLSGNLFTRISKFEIGNVSSLTYFSADSNHLQGNIPDSIFELHSLIILNLHQNNLTGTIPWSRFRKLQNLSDLYLSDNSLTIIDGTDIANSKPSWPDLEYLSLSSCNLGHFPGFIREHRNLRTLELSNNGITGLVPNWLFEIGTLTFLNLSHNSLQGGLENLPWPFMVKLDIQYNMFHGIIPTPSPVTIFFWASNNHFTGELHSSLCNVSGIRLLDLAHNNLTGSIPKCIASLIKSGLNVLDLRKNQLNGAIPSSLFQECPNLEHLSLSDNKLECQIPKSISNCSRLELLDLSSNNFNDKFPYWLGILPSLKVLILSSNKLYGSLMASNTASSFQMLQILDISNNSFTGTLPVELLMSMKAMATVDNTLSLSYMSSSVVSYQDSIVTWIKGAIRRLDAIYDKLVLIDASRNRLEGPIPDAIGDLISLRGLNLAHNNFTGHIPPSLSNLSLLESLDLSFNRLDGGIPTELVNLNSLAFFNVSENNLVGAVPTTKQFGTFSDPSYLGNLDLCGPWLTNKCGKLSDVPQSSATSEGSGDESSSLQVWEIGLIGCGCGLLGGLAWGYIIFWMNSPYWVQRLIFQIETIFIGYQWRKRKSSTRRTKKRDTQGRWI